MAFDERDRFAPERIRQVILLGHRLRTAKDLSVHRGAPLLYQSKVLAVALVIRKDDDRDARQEVVPTPQEPEELVEAPLHGVELRGNTQVPLAHHPGHIAGGLQVVRERGLLEPEPILEIRFVALRAETLLVPSGQQTRTRRAAPRSGHVPAREPHPAGSQGVETRRRDVRAALESEIRVAEIIGHDQQDVGFAVFRRRRDRRAAHRDGCETRSVLRAIRSRVRAYLCVLP